MRKCFVFDSILSNYTVQPIDHEEILLLYICQTQYITKPFFNMLYNKYDNLSFLRSSIYFMANTDLTYVKQLEQINDALGNYDTTLVEQLSIFLSDKVPLYYGINNISIQDNINIHHVNRIKNLSIFNISGNLHIGRTRVNIDTYGQYYIDISGTSLLLSSRYILVHISEMFAPTMPIKLHMNSTFKLTFTDNDDYYIYEVPSEHECGKLAKLHNNNLSLYSKLIKTFNRVI